MPVNALLGVTLGSTWLDHFLTGGRGNMHLYHVVFIYFAGPIVYPDNAVEGISEMIRKPLGWRCIILSELSFLFLMIAMTLHFRAIDPKFSSCEPVLFVSIWLAYRIIWSLLCHVIELE